MRGILFFLLIPLFSFSQTYDVLFIGNSYTYYNDLPEMISSIANDFGDSINHDQSTPGGTSLYAHSQNQATINKINQQNWDYVVLQDQSQRPSLSPSYVAANVYPYASQLVSLIDSNYICSEPIFYMTWGRKYGDQTNCNTYPPVCTFLGMQERLRESYLYMGLNNEAAVSPVGMSFKNSIALDSTIDLYTTDYSHPSIYGSYLAACTFYSTIFKKSSVGCSYKPSAISQSEALFLQQVASSTVLDSMSMWNIFQAKFDYNINGKTIEFLNKSSNYQSCVWDFGDGSQSTDISPLHTYQQNGLYNVILTIQTNSGCLTESYSVQFNINSSSFQEQSVKKYIIKSFNVLGNQIDDNFKGVVIELDSKGGVYKKIKF